MDFKIFYTLLNFLILTQCYTILDDFKVLKKLEFSNSELLEEAKDFDHSDLSYIWYDKYVDGLHWDITTHDLIYERGEVKISITDLLECRKKICCSNNKINNFLKHFSNIDEFEKFIYSLHNVIKIRTKLLKRNYF